MEYTFDYFVKRLKNNYKIAFKYGKCTVIVENLNNQFIFAVKEGDVTMIEQKYLSLELLLDNAGFQNKKLEEMWKLMKLDENYCYDNCETFESDIKLNSKKTSEQEYENLVKEALKIIIKTNTASISFLQRKLSIGFPMAGKLLDILVERGYVTDLKDNKSRKILITKEQFEKTFGEKID